MKGLMGLMALVLLAGCAAQPTDQWMQWTCDSKAQVLWRYADGSQQTVDLRLGGGDIVYHLTQEPGASGALYSNDVLAFHLKGDEGLVYWVANNDLIGRGCKAQ